MHLSGGKVTRAHTTATNEAARVVKRAEKLPCVSKIVLGVIVQSLPPGQARIKFLPITGGLRAEVRGSSSKQQLYIYTSDVSQTERFLQSLF